MGKGYKGKGTLFQIQNPNVVVDLLDDTTWPEEEAGTWVTIARVKSGGPTGDKRNAIDATTLDDPTDIDDFIPGTRTAGEINVVMHFVPEEATYQLMRALFVSGDTRHFRFLYDKLPNKPAQYYTAFVSGFEGPALAPNDLLAIPVKLTLRAPTEPEAPSELIDTE